MGGENKKPPWLLTHLQVKWGVTGGGYKERSGVDVMFRRIYKITTGFFRRCRADGHLEKIDVVKMSTEIEESVAQEIPCGRRFKELLGRLRGNERR